ncbi:MAG: amidohydrolase family protein [Flavobacteriaceae bacterium]
MGHSGDASRTIDVQTHYVPPAAVGLVKALHKAGHRTPGLGTLQGGDPKLGLDQRLRVMDEAGIATSLLSFAPIGVIADQHLAIALCRAANDGMLEACAAHPDRFVMAAVLPFPNPANADNELTRIAQEPALRAVQIIASTTRYLPEDDCYEPIYRRAATAQLPLILHPTAGQSDLAPQFDAYGLSSGMHAMISHALVAARMIQSGLLDRIPTLELILTHLGGILPFLIDRLDSRASGPAAFAPSHYLRTRLFVDACGYPAGPALRCAIEALGAERVMIGSDWPSRPIAPALAAIRELGLSEAAERAILRETAARWFDPSRARGH